MRFISTRGGDSAANAAEAIVRGLAADGGLFVPERFPSLKDSLAELAAMDYPHRAARVLSAFWRNTTAKSCSRHAGRHTVSLTRGSPLPS